MGKKSLKSCLKGMLPDMVSLRRKVQECAAKHPEMFVDVENSHRQVVGLTFSVSFCRDKDTGEISLLIMDAWLGHLKKPHAKMYTDSQGSITLEENDD